MRVFSRTDRDVASVVVGAVLVAVVVTLPSVRAAAQSTAEPTVRVFPRRPLFSPLSADLRWPRFAVAYAYYFGSSEAANVGAADAGASIPIVQKKGQGRGAWEIGLQGGIFAVFDLGAPSSDLINADYLGGLTFTYAIPSYAFLARIVHQSSHLGDEYLLHNEVDRINLSFEQLDVLVSHDLRAWAKVYGGAGVILRRDPSDLARWSLQAGAEIRPYTAKTKHRLQIMMAANLNFWQQSEWIPDASIVAGATLDPIGDSSYRVDFLLRYYVGRSPNGQFFTERIQTLGPAVQLYF